jgi:hypothetical protein
MIAAICARESTLMDELNILRTENRRLRAQVHHLEVS